MALAQRGAPVAQGTGVAVGVRGGGHGGLLGVFAHDFAVGAGQRREAGEVERKKEGKQAHRGKGNSIQKMPATAVPAEAGKGSCGSKFEKCA